MSTEGMLQKRRWDEKELAEKILRDAKECTIVMNTLKSEREQTMLQQNVVLRWSPPWAGWCKLNTDASRLNDLGHTAVGGVIRDENGLWLKGFNGSTGIASIFTAELRALRDGLLFASDMDIKLLMVESDSISAVNDIRDSDVESAEAYPLINDCRNLLKRDWRVHVAFQPGAKNKVADKLARMGHDDPRQLHIYETPRDEVQELLLADCSFSADMRE